MPPPAEARPEPLARRPLDDCVHCGFCLPACPTWNSWRSEMDSPRGRIDLMRALDAGRIRLDDATTAHFDRCLGCMACVPACPSGVRYDHLIEQARARVEREHRRPWRERLFRALVFAIFPYPARLRLAAAALWIGRVTGLRWLVDRLGVLRALAPSLAGLDALAPAVGWRHVSASLPPAARAAGTRRARVALVGGCVQRIFFPNVNEATVRVLAAEGCDVEVPDGQGCCGALSAHAGRHAEAVRLARDLVLRFEGLDVDAIVVNAAGCGSHLKDLGALFEGDPFQPRAAAFAARVRDVTELLGALGPVAPRGRIEARIAYHSPCHLGHAQGIVRAPRELLRGIPGVELVEVPNGEECCGSAGVYNLLQPESAAEIGRRKADAVASTGAALIASANPGCTLQIRRHLRERGTDLEALHPVELLDAAIRAGSGRSG